MFNILSNQKKKQISQSRYNFEDENDQTTKSTETISKEVN